MVLPSDLPPKEQLENKNSFLSSLPLFCLLAKTGLPGFFYGEEIDGKSCQFFCLGLCKKILSEVVKRLEFFSAKKLAII